jgi:hypothetical protein
MSVTSPATTLTVQSLRDGVLPRSWTTCTLPLSFSFSLSLSLSLSLSIYIYIYIYLFICLCSRTNSLMKDNFNYVRVLLQFPSWKPVNGFYSQRAWKHQNSQKLVSFARPFVSIYEFFILEVCYKRNSVLLFVVRWSSISFQEIFLQSLAIYPP